MEPVEKRRRVFSDFAKTIVIPTIETEVGITLQYEDIMNLYDGDEYNRTRTGYIGNWYCMVNQSDLNSSDVIISFTVGYKDKKDEWHQIYSVTTVNGSIHHYKTKEHDRAMEIVTTELAGDLKGIMDI